MTLGTSPTISHPYKTPKSIALNQDYPLGKKVLMLDSKQAFICKIGYAFFSRQNNPQGIPLMKARWCKLMCQPMLHTCILYNSKGLMRTQFVREFSWLPLLLLPGTKNERQYKGTWKIAVGPSLVNTRNIQLLDSFCKLVLLTTDTIQLKKDGCGFLKSIWQTLSWNGELQK